MNVAFPELNLTLLKVVLPSLKVMMPLGVSEAGANALTVAVKLTLWFRIDGLPEVLIATDVAAWFTVSVTGEEVLPKNIPPPL